MKRNKVLLGLYVGLLTLAGGVANAQADTLYEIGPDNIGGQVSSIVVDQQDASRNTLYAGATTGGLFLKTPSTEILSNLYSRLGMDEAKTEQLSTLHEIWHRVPFKKNGREISLPISSMTQAPSGEIFIGTGSDVYAHGTTYGKMSCKGMGVYCYISTTNEFKQLTATDPAVDTNFKVVNDMTSYYDAESEAFYLFVATNGGLYRWTFYGDRSTWNFAAAPTLVQNGEVDNIVVTPYFKMAFFSAGNHLYRLGDITATPRPVDLFNGNPAFGANTVSLKLAVTQNDTLAIYAMAINQAGYMEGLYRSSDEQNWTLLTTTSIMPFTYTSGMTCGAIAIDPANTRRVIIGGTNVLMGEGFVEGAYFQWTTTSASEYELNAGDYMASVYYNTSFIHSGIHQILPVYHTEGNSDYHRVFFATDGGIYSSKFYGRNGFDTVVNENRGLNNMQINDLDVSPDGTIIMGANFNSCPIIESHLSHNGGKPSISWYDDGSLGNFNHTANILWTGNGGAVAASAFQQVSPQSRRTIIVSSEDANLGRSYADYLDFTNTNTWTTGAGFRSNEPIAGPQMGSLSLWETDTNKTFNNMIRVTVDTLGYILRKRNSSYDTVWLALPGTTRAVRLAYRDSITGIGDTVRLIDTIPVGTGRGSSFRIISGDKAFFNSRGNADYPFEYTYTAPHLAKDTLTIVNPVQARMVFIADLSLPSDKKAGARSVWFSWEPTDFTKVFDTVELAAAQALQKQGEDVDMNAVYEKFHVVTPILNILRTSGTPLANLYPRQAVFSRDARCVYVSAYDEVTHRSMLFRIRGFENANFNQPSRELYYDLSYKNSSPVLQVDTMHYNGSVWFPRPISHIAVDGRRGQDRLVLTFEDYSDAMANVLLVNNASASYSINAIPLPDVTLPVYTAIVEDSLGTIFVGTADGVYTKTATTSWQPYSILTGVPVTTIVQQTSKLPIRRNLTHTAITPNHYVFAKTKWPRAIYFGTYGRGVFMNMKYVTDTINEIVEPQDYVPVAIPTVHSIGNNSVKLFPNPVFDEAHMVLNVTAAGNGEMRVYDLNGRLVMRRNLGHISEGEHSYTIDCNGLAKGMYLVNVFVSGHTATAKMIVR